jgi:hypothetical protein
MSGFNLCIPINETDISKTELQYNVMSPSSYTHISARDLYISRISLPILLQGNMFTRSQTHECGNWDWGRAIPRKVIHNWDFPFSVFTHGNWNHEWNTLLVLRWLLGYSTVGAMHLCHTEAKSKVPDWGMKSTLSLGKGRFWHRPARGKCVGVGKRWGYSQLRHRVPYTMFFLWLRALFS